MPEVLAPARTVGPVDTVELNGRAFTVVRTGKEAAEAGTKDLLVVKSAPVSRAIVVDAENRVLRQPISDASVDRDGDTIALDGWDFSNWMKNPVVQWAHDYHQPPIARGLRVWTEGGMVWSEAQYAGADLNPFADQVYRMKLGHFLGAASVGFLPTDMAESDDPEREDGWGPGYNFLRQELLEWSDVPVPANANAVAAAIATGALDPEVLAKMGFDVERPKIVVNAHDGQSQKDTTAAKAAADGELGPLVTLLAEMRTEFTDAVDKLRADIGTLKNAPADQPARPDGSAAKSVLTPEQIARIAAEAAAKAIETRLDQVMGRVSAA